MSNTDQTSTQPNPSDGGKEEAETPYTASDDVIELGDIVTNMIQREIKRVVHFIFHHTQDKSISTLKQLLIEKETIICQLETRADRLKRHLKSKNDTIRQLEDQLQEDHEKEEKAISALNDDLIAVRDENVDLKRKYSMVMSKIQCLHDDVHCTTASKSETNVESDIARNSSSSFGPTPKKMKSADSTEGDTQSTPSTSPISPSTFRSFLEPRHDLE